MGDNKTMIAITIFAACFFLCVTMLSRSYNDSYLIHKLTTDNKKNIEMLIKTEKKRQKAEKNIMLLSGRINEMALSKAMDIQNQAKFLFNTVCEIEDILRQYDVLEGIPK